MQYSASSIPFLWAAYILVFVAQIAYVGFLARRWSRTEQGRHDR